MALIIRETEQLEFHTDLYEIIAPFEEKFASLKWTLSNQDYMLLDYEEKGIVEKLNHDDPIIEFDGSELLDIIKNRKIQFIWGVFCGYKNKVPQFKRNKIPFADCNSDIWEKPDKFLTKYSDIEIICFDGTSTIVKFKDKQDEIKFLKKFKEANYLN
jgi:hypothetical protein